MDKQNVVYLYNRILLSYIKGKEVLVNAATELSLKTLFR